MRDGFKIVLVGCIDDNDVKNGKFNCEMFNQILKYVKLKFL